MKKPPPKKLNPLYELVKQVRQDLVPGTKIVVGCSGGKDSKTLAGVLQEAGMHVIAFHVDHGLRPESAQEQIDLYKWAKKEGIEFMGTRLQLSSSAEGPARQARRDALISAAHKVGAEYISLGHTARDQVETLLMRLTRGTGLRGLGCMRKYLPQEGTTIYRPLLRTKQKDILSYMEYRGWVAIEDPTNEQDCYTRNRFRKEVIPFLEKENARVEEAVPRLVESLQEDNDALDFYTEIAWKEFVHSNYSSSYLTSKVPAAIARRLIIKLWYTHAKTGARQISSRHIDAVIHIASKNSGSTNLPGVSFVAHKGILEVKTA